MSVEFKKDDHSFSLNKMSVHVGCGYFGGIVETKDKTNAFRISSFNEGVVFAKELRQIADKLDELNGVEVSDEALVKILHNLITEEECNRYYTGTDAITRAEAVNKAVSEIKKMIGGGE